MPSIKPVLAPLKTPSSATFPSEISLKGPQIKREDDLSTPITPPVAYTDFLKALTPVVPSPLSAEPLSFSERSSGSTTPTTAPSTSSSFPARCDGINTPATASSVQSPSFLHPRSASHTPNSLRRLRIPVSPAFGPDSPRSGTLRSPFSPADWSLDSARYFDYSRSTSARPVSVRSVVTRTIVYKRTPLDPVPKGKKRKISETRDSEPESVKTTVTTPVSATAVA